MLIEFSVENYRSIADKQTISFVASKHRSNALGQAAVDAPGLRSQKLLTSAVLYGANASGKSNIVRALAEFARHIDNSAKDSAHDIQPFRLDSEWSGKPTRFEVAFLLDGVRYQYGYAVDVRRIWEEWLIAYPRKVSQLWFERSWDGDKPKMQFGSGLKGEKSRIFSATRPNALFLSVAAQLNQEQLIPIHEALTRGITVRQAAHVSVENTARMFETWPEKGRTSLAKLLGDADVGIQNVVVRRHKVDVLRNQPEISTARSFFVSSSNEEVYEIKTSHETAVGPVLFDLADESEGTIKYFTLLSPIMTCLSRGAVLAMDELDASLHPLLVRKIIGLFHDPKSNSKGAQLFFNTHDTTLLDPELFRRDQIWFVEKEPPGKSRFYSLLEFSPRRNEALQKGYLEGRYGAIPFLGDFALSEMQSEGKGTRR